MQADKCRLLLTDYGPIVVLPDSIPVESAQETLNYLSRWMTKNVNWQETGAQAQVLAMFKSGWDVEDWRGRV